MKRVVLVAVVAVAGCSSHKAKAPADEAAQQVAEAPAPAAAAPQAAAEPDKPVVIDDALLGKYVEAQKQIVADLTKYVDETRADLKKTTEKDSTAASLAMLKRADERNKKLDEAKKAAIARAGLTDREYDAAADAVTSVTLARKVYENAGGDAAIEKMERDLKKQLASMPAAERAKLEPEMMKIPETMRASANGKDCRDKYGDAAADAILKRYAELAPLRDRMLGLLTDKR